MGVWERRNDDKAKVARCLPHGGVSNTASQAHVLLLASPMCPAPAPCVYQALGWAPWPRSKTESGGGQHGVPSLPLGHQSVLPTFSPFFQYTLLPSAPLQMLFFLPETSPPCFVNSSSSSGSQLDCSFFRKPPKCSLTSSAVLPSDIVLILCCGCLALCLSTCWKVGSTEAESIAVFSPWRH